MKLFGHDFSRKEADPTAGGVSIDTILSRLHAFHEAWSGINVTPENCMQAPTVQAIIQAVSRRIATLPVGVYKKRVGPKGRTIKEEQPDHPVTEVLKTPNAETTDNAYWLDATSVLLRHHKYYAYKARGNTGPIQWLRPLHPNNVTPHQNDDYTITYKVIGPDGRQRDIAPSDMHYVRGPARDFYCGDSPVNDVRESIAMEIAAEKFGASFFGNGAMPFLIFKFVEGSKGFKTDEDAKKFINDFQGAYSDRRRFKAMAIPAGMDVADPITVENNKAQFLETRAYQRTVIAGAWGVPPHLVGDLSRGTYNNVEQQSLEFIISVVYPYIKMFESAMEKDFLTPADRKNGIIIRFNLDAALRGDFKSRQDGLLIQRRNGIINANEWREHENMNPLSEEDGGEDYWVESGVTVVGAEPGTPGGPPAPTAPKPAPKPAPPKHLSDDELSAKADQDYRVFRIRFKEMVSEPFKENEE
jgi:HK97 family phage portal protein